MSSYIQSTNFATKDALTSGDPLKIVKGTEINTEFVNIAVAVATKADLASPTFTGIPAAPTASAGNNSTQIATTAYIDAAITAVKAALFPVGSIYTNATNATNPGTLLGFGTWTAFGAGRVMIGDGVTNTVTAGAFAIGSKYTIVSVGSTNFTLIGAAANTVGIVFTATGVGTGTGTASTTFVANDTGGSADATLPSHTHTATVTDAGHSHTTAIPLMDDTIGSGVNGIQDGDNSFANPSFSSNTVTTGISVGISDTGSSATNANYQPYITVYMWRRTA